VARSGRRREGTTGRKGKRTNPGWLRRGILRLRFLSGAAKKDDGREKSDARIRRKKKQGGSMFIKYLRHSAAIRVIRR